MTEKFDKETEEILANPDLMRRIKAAEEDIRAGRTRRVLSVKDLVRDSTDERI